MLAIDGFFEEKKIIEEKIRKVVDNIFDRFLQMAENREDLRLQQILTFMNLVVDSFHQIQADTRMRKLILQFEEIIINYSELKTEVLQITADTYHKTDQEYEQNRKEMVEEMYDPNYLTFYSFDDICQFYYCFTLLRMGSPQFMDHLQSSISKKYLLISRKTFSKVVYAFMQAGNPQIIHQLNPLIKELHRYGDFKYFFNHEDFIKLIWSACMFNANRIYPIIPSEVGIPKLFSLSSVSQVTLNVQDVFDNNFELMKMISKFANRSVKDLKDSMLDMNPNTLSPLGLKLNIQVLVFFNFLSQFQMDKDINTYLEGIQPHFRNFYISEGINKGSRQDQQGEVIHEKLLAGFSPVGSKISQIFGEGEGYSNFVVDNFVDNSLQYLNVASIVKHVSSENEICKVGVIVLTDSMFTDLEKTNMCADEKTNLLVLTFALNWNLIVIREPVISEFKGEELTKYFLDCLEDLNLQKVKKDFEEFQNSEKEEKNKDSQQQQEEQEEEKIKEKNKKRKNRSQSKSLSDKLKSKKSE